MFFNRACVSPDSCLRITERIPICEKLFSPAGVFDVAGIFSPSKDFSCYRRRVVKNYSITLNFSIKSCFCVGTNDKLDLGTISYIANCDVHTSIQVRVGENG